MSEDLNERTDNLKSCLWVSIGAFGEPSDKKYGIILKNSQHAPNHNGSGKVIETLFAVFQIFDDDGDGLLSYQEFVAMMKDRIHRGLKSYSRYHSNFGWEPTGYSQRIPARR